jgi:hypothetical protein
VLVSVVLAGVRLVTGRLTHWLAAPGQNRECVLTRCCTREFFPASSYRRAVSHPGRMRTSSRCGDCKAVTFTPNSYTPAAFERLFLQVDATDVGYHLSLASEATVVRTGGVCTAVVCVAVIIGLDNVFTQVGRAGEGADLAERVLGKLGHRFRETLA